MLEGKRVLLGTHKAPPSTLAPDKLKAAPPKLAPSKLKAVPPKLSPSKLKAPPPRLAGKKRVFVSFDFDNDKILKAFLVQQAQRPDSPFELADWSMKEAAPMRFWENQAEARIRRCHLVIVMVGPHTHRAPGVLKEVAMARRWGVPICQIIGYKDGDYTPVPDAGRLCRWNWENLKQLCRA